MLFAFYLYQSKNKFHEIACKVIPSFSKAMGAFLEISSLSLSKSGRAFWDIIPCDIKLMLTSFSVNEKVKLAIFNSKVNLGTGREEFLECRECRYWQLIWAGVILVCLVHLLWWICVISITIIIRRSLVEITFELQISPLWMRLSYNLYKNDREQWATPANLSLWMMACMRPFLLGLSMNKRTLHTPHSSFFVWEWEA